MIIPNKTAEDARIRVHQARIGSMALATDNYLLQLEASLHAWADEVHRELMRRCQQQIDTPEE